jgi:hypothetical protein
VRVCIFVQSKSVILCTHSTQLTHSPAPLSPFALLNNSYYVFNLLLHLQGLDSLLMFLDSFFLLRNPLQQKLVLPRIQYVLIQFLHHPAILILILVIKVVIHLLLDTREGLACVLDIVLLCDAS